MTGATSRYRCTLVLFPLLCGSSPLLAAAPQRPTLILWHSLEVSQANLLYSIGAQVAAEAGYELRLETGFNLSTALVRLGSKHHPDVLLAPADLLESAQFANFSEIPASLLPRDVPSDMRAALTKDEVVRGLPLLVGNHLMLFYNRRLAARPPTDFESIPPPRQGLPPFAWSYREPYYLLPFLGAFATAKPGQKSSPISSACPFSRAGIAAAFTAYRSLSLKGLVAPDCDYHCMTTSFYQGHHPYAISGDWALEEAHKHLGQDLGVAPLPKLQGRAITSYYMPTALFFPKDSLNGPKGIALKNLAQVLADKRAQRRFLAEGQRLPATLPVSMDPSSLPTPELRDSLRMLRQARPMVQLPNVWFWAALRRAFDLFLTGKRSAIDAARLVGEVCPLSAPDPSLEDSP